MTRPTSDGVVPWPPDIAQSYRNAGLWEDRSVYSFAAEAASRHPEAIAVVDGEMRLTYRELMHRADSCAFRLRELGFVRDDRLLVQLPNGWEFIALTLACLRIGVIPVMALPAHRSHELEHLARLSDSTAVVVPDEHRDFDHQAMAQLIAQRVESVTTVIVLGRADPGSLSLQELLEPLGQPDLSAVLDRDMPAGDDVAVFLLSGGTTGLPKLITRTHNDYAYNIMATSAVAGLGPESVYLVALPASHNFPLACPGFFGTLCAGGRVVTAGSPDPSRCLELIRREGVTITAAVPAVAQRWIEHLDRTGEPPPPSLEVLQVGGSRLADELAARVAPVLGAKLQQVFGMAEGLICMTRLDDSDDIIIGTQGRPSLKYPRL